MRRVGLYTHPACGAHSGGPGHPERPERLAAVEERLRLSGQLEELVHRRAEPASVETLGTVHDAAYLVRMERAFLEGAAFVDSPDANGGAATPLAARAASAAVLEATARVLAGDLDAAFAAVRPPGHHAEEGLAMGFCFTNHVALAARAAREVGGLERVAIVDFDVHHGNGTQHLFERDPSVLYASLHESPHYPGTGAASERGLGDGEGATLNCPMNAGADNETYTQAFTEKILPAIDAFGPDMILISAGFDAHQADPLGSINLTTEYYAWMTRRLMECADHHCNGRILSVLEGGYDLDALALSVAVHIETLKGFGSVEKP